MFEDPIVEEVHQIRREQAARFDFDLKRILQDARTRQERSGHEIIRATKVDQEQPGSTHDRSD
jgi:hypothetical protein